MWPSKMKAVDLVCNAGTTMLGRVPPMLLWGYTFSMVVTSLSRMVYCDALLPIYCLPAYTSESSDRRLWLAVSIV